MDTITHAIIGATVGRATAPDEIQAKTLTIKQRVSIGALAAAFPDIDYFTNLIHPLAFIAEWHRSLTHSFIMLPIWAFTVGFILAWLLGKRQFKKEIMVICGLAIFSHILTDLITSWGTQIFSPISDYSVAWGLTFIIDPYFSGIVLAALIFAIVRNSRITAGVGLAALTAYIGFQGVLKYQADSIGQNYIAKQAWHNSSVYTMPQPYSPFHWKIVVKRDTQYHLALVNLLAEDPSPLPDENDTSILGLVHYYRPKEQLDWNIFHRVTQNPQVTTAWNRPEFDLFRKFARLPFLYEFNDDHNEQCAWFGDLRFLLPRINLPFRYGLCQEIQSDRWNLYRLHGDSITDRELIPVY